MAQVGSLIQFDESQNPAVCLGIIMHWLDPLTSAGGTFSMVDTQDPTKGFIGFWANGDRGASCQTASGQREVTVTFKCQASGNSVLTNLNEDQTQACSYRADFLTCGACKGGCGAGPSPAPGPAGGSGMSFGAVFLIILAAVVPVYILGSFSERVCVCVCNCMCMCFVCGGGGG